MAASERTITEIVAVLRRHCDDRQLRRIVTDLLEVPGNKSFRDTVETVAHQTGVIVTGRAANG